MTTTENKPTNSAPELSPEAKRARAEYTKKYRAAHPERVRAWNKNYWEKMARTAPVPSGEEVTED